MKTAALLQKQGADPGSSASPKTRRKPSEQLWVWQLVVPLIILIIWQTFPTLGWVRPDLLPPPTKVIRTAYASLMSGELLLDTLHSAKRVLIGFLLSAVTGIPVGLAMGTSRRVRAMMRLTLNMVRSIPPIAWTPLAILWFGIGEPPGLFLIFLGAFFPIMLNTFAGVTTIDPVYLRVAENVGARGFRLFWDVTLKGSLPSILTGLRVSIGLSWMVVVVAEMIAVPQGLGYRMQEAREYGWTDRVIVTMVIIGLMGVLFDRSMLMISRRLAHWQKGMG